MTVDPNRDLQGGSQLSQSAGHSGATTDPEHWVDRYGDCLFKYAIVRLRDSSLAEDMVQETFLAALRGRQRFEGRSAEQSWLIGILKNKIYDYYRRAGRETSFTNLEFYADEERERFSRTGLSKGGWIHELGPSAWSQDSVTTLANQEFWKTLHDCTSKLPHTIAAAFTLREMDGLETNDICEILGISPNNLWVMLHRARMALRSCLEIHWFGTAIGKQPGMRKNKAQKSRL